ncbi:MAG TPA: hypothetical protein VFV52_11645 [Bacilli bacterium]|nr:hypothetical protein [Bacilli bacterium]
MMNKFANLVGAAPQNTIEPEVYVYCDYGCTAPGDSYHEATWHCSSVDPTNCWIYSCSC